MKKIYIISFLLIVWNLSLTGQRDQTVLGGGGIDLTGVWGGWVNTLANFDDNFDLNNGGFVVFELNKNFLIGWTGYGNEFKTSQGIDAEITNNDLLLGYNFHSYKSVHPLLYLQMGGGSLEVENEEKDKVFVIQPSVGVEANITRWFRLSVEGGYRFTTNVNTPDFTDKDLSSFFIGARFKFGWSWD